MREQGKHTCAASLMRWLSAEARLPSSGRGHPRTVEGCGSAAEDSTALGRTCCEAGRRCGALDQQCGGQDTSKAPGCWCAVAPL